MDSADEIQQQRCCQKHSKITVMATQTTACLGRMLAVLGAPAAHYLVALNVRAAVLL